MQHFCIVLMGSYMRELSVTSKCREYKWSACGSWCAHMDPRHKCFTAVTFYRELEKKKLSVDQIPTKQNVRYIVDMKKAVPQHICVLGCFHLTCFFSETWTSITTTPNRAIWYLEVKGWLNVGTSTNDEWHSQWKQHTHLTIFNLRNLNIWKIVPHYIYL